MEKVQDTSSIFHCRKEEMIDEKIHSELRQKFNPEGSELRKLQNRMLEMLVWLDKFCRENDIQYWITDGTLLGAIRHKGFIPWDDDIDIFMMPEDYKLFSEKFSETDQYVLQTPGNDLFYSSPYAKLRDKHSLFVESDGSDINFKYRGIFIDIFTLERCPFIFAKIALHLRWRLSTYAKKTDISKFGKYLFKIRKYGLYTLISIFRFLSRKTKGDLLRPSMGTGFLEEKRYESDLFPLCKVIFEGYEFYAPHNWDHYLSALYGNYMEIPTIDAIKTHALQFKTEI